MFSQNTSVVAGVALAIDLIIMPAFAQTPQIPDYALRAWDEAKGLAVQPAFDWAKKERMICDGPNDRSFPCTVANRTEGVRVFSPDPELSIVQIFFNPSTGNRGITAHLLLGRKKAGEFRILREMKNIPSAIQSVAFEGSRLVLDVEVRKPDDLGCCPTGIGRYAYDLRSEKVDYLWGDRPGQ